MYLDMPDGYAGWLLRHLKSKPLCLYSSILVLILCPLGLPLSSVMSVPSLKFIHVSASVQCPVVASSYSGSLSSILVFAFVSVFQSVFGYSSRFFSSFVLPCVRPSSESVRVIQSSVFGLSFSVFSLLQSSSVSVSVSVSSLPLPDSVHKFRFVSVPAQCKIHPC